MDLFFSIIFWLSRVTTIAKLFSRLHQKYDVEFRSLRHIEKLSLKIAHLRCHNEFLNSCRNNNLFPKFLNFKDRNNLFNTEHINNAKMNKLNSIIKQQRHKLKRLLRQRAAEILNLKRIIGYFDFFLFCKVLNNTISLHAKKKKVVHTKKLQTLWRNQKLCVPENTVLNFSSSSFDDKTLSVLKQGLKAPILPRNDIHIPIQVQLERILYILGNSVHKNHTNSIGNSLNDFHRRIVQMNSSPPQREFRNLIKTLRKRSDVKICRFDKGNGIAILDSSDYLRKLHSIIDDTTKFVEIQQDESDLKCHHTVIKENSRMGDILKKEVKPVIDDLTFSKINKRGGQPAKLYGVAKVHKPNIPVRPIIASFDTVNYELGKYLNRFITPVIPKQYTVQKNSDLLTDLRSYKFTDDSILVSFDVESLFTNVPLEETINIAANLVYDKNENKPPFPKNTFIKLLRLATSNLFLFDGKLYRQKDGLAMGSPLAPTLSNLFMGVLECKHLKSKHSKNVKFYRRFVDDLALIFENENDIVSFFNYANSWHPNIKFTKEIGQKNIPFLDINIDITNNELTTDVYRKPTYTGLILNYKALCPNHWKTGLLFTLLHRAYEVCSNWVIFHKEIGRLTEIFKQNGYPVSFIHRQVRKFLSEKFNNSPNFVTDNFELSRHIIMIPYVGIQSIIFKKKLKQHLKRISHNFTISCVFFTNKLGSCFSLKDVTPLPLRAGVVYKFVCEVDPRFSYIGKTIRHLGIRISEHNKRISAIYDHRLNCSCACSSNNFKILGTDTNDFQLKIMEAIFIKTQNPTLNKQLNNDGSFFACKLS